MELKERTNITSHIQFLIQLLNHNRHHYQYHSLTPYHQCREHEIYFLGLGSLLIYSPPGTADLGSVAGTVTDGVGISEVDGSVEDSGKSVTSETNNSDLDYIMKKV